MATPSDNSDLKRLIRAAGYTCQTVDRTRIELLFAGPYRPWVIRPYLGEAWLFLGTYVCALPEPPGRRAALAELLMGLNGENAIAKYSFKKDEVVLQLQYRREHVDADSMHGLVGIMCACANDDYPRIVRLLTGDDALERLAEQFEPASLAT